MHGPNLLRRRVFGAFDQRCLRTEFATSRLAAEVIDGLISSGRRYPPARVRRHAIVWPLPQGDHECLLDRVLGEVDVAEDTDQDCNRPTTLLTEDPGDTRAIDDRQ